MSQLGKAPFVLAAVVVAASFFVASCDSALDEVSAPSVAAPTAALDAEVVFPGYTVEFLEARDNGDGTTTFEYRLTGTDPGPPSLDWFFLENACDGPALSLVPDNAVGTATVSGIDGYRWQASLPAGQTRIYSYSFPSEAALGAVRTVISRGGVKHGPASLPGPCGGLVTLSGFVFVDGNEDGAKGADELGVAGVVVDVSHPTGFSAQTSTDSDGAFSISVLRADVIGGGDYTVSIPEGAPQSVNAILHSSYEYTGGVEPSKEVSGLANESGIDFGFAPNTEKIVEDLSGEFQTQAESVRWWRNEVRRAARNGKCQPPGEVCREELEGYLLEIFSGIGPTHLLLADPYVYDGADMFEQALAILSGKPKSDLGVVFQNLFAMQLNYLHGWGTPVPNYDIIVFSYLEDWVFNHEDYAAARPGGAHDALSAEIGDAIPGTQGKSLSDEKLITETYLAGGGGGGGVE